MDFQVGSTNVYLCHPRANICSFSFTTKLFVFCQNALLFWFLFEEYSQENSPLFISTLPAIYWFVVRSFVRWPRAEILNWKLSSQPVLQRRDKTAIFRLLFSFYYSPRIDIFETGLWVIWNIQAPTNALSTAHLNTVIQCQQMKMLLSGHRQINCKVHPMTAYLMLK